MFSRNLSILFRMSSLLAQRCLYVVLFLASVASVGMSLYISEVDDLYLMFPDQTSHGFTNFISLLTNSSF